MGRHWARRRAGSSVPTAAALPSPFSYTTISKVGEADLQISYTYSGTPGEIGTIKWYSGTPGSEVLLLTQVDVDFSLAEGYYTSGWVGEDNYFAICSVPGYEDTTIGPEYLT